MPRRLSALALSLALSVAPLVASAQGPAPEQAIEDDIRDIRGPIATPEPWWSDYVPWALAGLALIVVAGIASRLARKRRAPDAYAVVTAELARARASIGRGTGAAFSDAVSTAVRRYIEARFAIDAPARTTDELLHFLANSDRSPLRLHRARLLELLVFCDLARFGGFSLAAEEMESMHGVAARFVEETWRAKDASSPPARETVSS